MGNFLHSGLGLRAAAWCTGFGLVALLSSCGGGYGGGGGGGVIATTVDRRNRTLSVSAASGQRLATLTKDSVEMGHWATELTAVSAAELARFESGQWFASVATAADPGGALEGQIRAPRD
jgi:hypothetical protein